MVVSELLECRGLFGKGRGMFKRILLSAVIVAVVSTVAATSCLAVIRPGGGKVVTPFDDPVEGITVKFYRGSTCIGSTTTNSQGTWSVYFYFCDELCTACVGSYRPKSTECVTELIQCSGYTAFADIVLECGGPKQPPCPGQ